MGLDHLAEQGDGRCRVLRPDEGKRQIVGGIGVVRLAPDLGRQQGKRLLEQVTPDQCQTVIQRHCASNAALSACLHRNKRAVVLRIGARRGPRPKFQRARVPGSSPAPHPPEAKGAGGAGATPDEYLCLREG